MVKKKTLPIPKNSNRRYVLGEVICDITNSKCEYEETDCDQCPNIT